MTYPNWGILCVYPSRAALKNLTTLFRTNRSQAGRLGKDVAFPDNVREVVVLRDGARRVIVLAGVVWDDFFEAPGVDLGARQQPPAQTREAF